MQTEGGGTVKCTRGGRCMATEERALGGSVGDKRYELDKGCCAFIAEGMLTKIREKNEHSLNSVKLREKLSNEVRRYDNASNVRFPLIFI